MAQAVKMSQDVDHGGKQEGGGAAYRQQWVACLMPVREISMLQRAGTDAPARLGKDVSSHPSPPMTCQHIAQPTSEHGEKQTCMA